MKGKAATLLRTGNAAAALTKTLKRIRNIEKNLREGGYTEKKALRLQAIKSALDLRVKSIKGD